MSHAVYPYRVEYRKTEDWWDGHWDMLSTWCDDTFGPGNWNYYFDGFVFTEQAHQMLFKLKWKWS